MKLVFRSVIARVMFSLCVLSLHAQVSVAQNSARQKPPTFSKEIVRIFQNHCQRCHHAGAPFAPMSLVKYGEVRPWAKAIHKKVVSKAMPPWHADSSIREFTNDISITQQEIDTIERWVKGRAPQGNPADLPPVKVFKDGWQIGEPDLILDTDTDFAVPATGTVPIKFFRVNTNFKEEKWLSAIEAIPGNREVVQQIDIYVQNPDEGQEIPEAGTLGNGFLGTYSRGTTSSSFRDGEGKLIKPGANIIFRILYNPNGTATIDRSRVAFRFQKEPVQKHVITRGISETGFEIPPHIPDFTIYATYTFTESVTLNSMRPLMHYRGEGFKYIAHFPDGRNEVLLNVDRYDYSWQTHYYPNEPIRLPSGTVLECIAVMNNSHENYRNPEPHAVVSYGDQLIEEKMIGWVNYTRDSEVLTSKETDL